MQIGPHTVGAGHPCFVIAEAGVNHNGSPELAHELVEAAAAAGAHAVKFQTFSAARLASPNAVKAGYQIANTGAAEESQLEMLRKLELADDTFAALSEHCRKLGILFLSTPFDEEAADFLDRLGMPAFKSPSGEITNLPYQRHLARKGKPMLVSTGMASLGEIDRALEAIEKAGAPPVALLQCTSNYPAPPEQVNLRAMPALSQAFDLPVGYSDHTMGVEVALAAVALGATVLEKHFTLDRTMPGPDHLASLEPEELTRMIAGIRTVEAALGARRKRPGRAELEVARVARKSLVVVEDLAPGTVLEPRHLRIMRPGTGLAPEYLDFVLGLKTSGPIAAGTPLTREMLG